MQTRQLALHRPNLDGLPLLVVGAGRSGRAAARLTAAKGADVTLCDARALEQLPPEAATLDDPRIRLVTGGHPAELAENVALVIVSPGVPETVPLLARARALGVPIWGEVELAYRFCEGRIVGITGSNGKSTVTTMVGGILRQAGLPGATGGNLDRPLSEMLRDDSPQAWHSLELSSFQLATIHAFRAQVGVVLNLSADHLDRHGSLEHYAEAKARLLNSQQEGDASIVSADDEHQAFFADRAGGQLYRFSVRGAVERGAYVDRGRLWLRTENEALELLDVDELPIPGPHNVANALAAALATHLAGCDLDAIRRGLREYRALPHRLEFVRELHGVRYFNDSKATNPASTAVALDAFPSGTVHLILGGRDKDSDWEALLEAIADRARHVWLIGECADTLERRLRGRVGLTLVRELQRAVGEAHAAAAAGEVVLLSPACASFDQFTNFAHRGECFARAVHALAPLEGRHG